MSLFSQWEEKLKNITTKEEYENFFKEYMSKEAEIYQRMLADQNPVLKGIVKDLSAEYSMTDDQFVRFLDGAHTSLKEPLKLDELTEDSEINIEFDYEKLLWNMYDAKAEWLYNMDEWKNIFDDEKRNEIKKDYNRSKIVVKEAKIGRNDPCPCGSGKKYKKCCGK